ncbi:MAG TPA: MauE/DoxX family redox-associated membrane protein [Pirellulales bacterium]|nr:MauE/DoxX family redox-associated membrane protein [Pirellulales bacterium]
MPTVKGVLKYVQGALYIVAGMNHFINPAFYLKIMPPYLPWHALAVFVSGLAEVFLGVLLMIPRTTKPAAWGLIALLLAVFPANIYVYQHQEIFPDVPPSFHLARLPIQGLLILWAWWYTRD